MRPKLIAGLSLLAGGDALLALSFTSMPWYRAGNGPYAHPPFGHAPRSFDDLRAHFRIAGTGREGAIYFGWLWWAFIAGLVVTAGLGAWMGWPSARWVSLGLGVVAAWTAHSAFSDIVEADGSLTARAGLGLWVAMAGYVSAGLGAYLAQPAAPQRGIEPAVQRGSSLPV